MNRDLRSLNQIYGVEKDSVLNVFFSADLSTDTQYVLSFYGEWNENSHLNTNVDRVGVWITGTFYARHYGRRGASQNSNVFWDATATFVNDSAAKLVTREVCGCAEAARPGH
jgi:hypothetical protein